MSHHLMLRIIVVICLQFFVLEGQETVRVLETQALHMQYLILGKAVKYLPAHYVWSLIYVYDKKYMLHDQLLRPHKVSFLDKIFNRKNTCLETETFMVNAHNGEYEDFLYRALDQILTLYWLHGSHAFKIAEVTTRSMCLKSQSILLNHITALWPISIIQSAKNWRLYEANKIIGVSRQLLGVTSREFDQSLYYSFKEKERATEKLTISDIQILNNEYKKKILGELNDSLNDQIACVSIVPKGENILNILWLSLLALARAWSSPLHYPSNLIIFDDFYFSIKKHEELLFDWPTKNINDKTKIQLVFGGGTSCMDFYKKCMKKVKLKKYIKDSEAV